MEDIPVVRYARSEGFRIAYQCFGEGPPTVVVPPLVTNLEVLWEHEFYRRIFVHCSAHSEWIHFDKRGMGLSDRFLETPTAGQQVEDVLAVMDDLDIESVNLLGISEGGAIARHLAASHPERVDTVAMVNTMAPLSMSARVAELSADRHVAMEDIVRAFQNIAGCWGEDVTPFVELICPSQVDNDTFVRWMSRFNRLAVSPADFAKQLSSSGAVIAEIPVVPSQIPTTIVQVRDDRCNPVGNGRALAESMPHATYIEVEGTDHYFIGQDNWREVMDPTVELITGTTPTGSSSRQFAVVLFTDIVGSTELLGSLGDNRWREMIESHDRIAHRTTAANRGRVVKSTGDGMLAVFDLPSHAADAIVAMRSELSAVGLAIRAGLHAGEIEVHADLDISGIAVNIAARIESAADGGQILISSALNDMLLGSTHSSRDQGRHQLKGVAGDWHLYSLA